MALHSKKSEPKLLQRDARIAERRYTWQYGHTDDATRIAGEVAEIAAADRLKRARHDNVNLHLFQAVERASSLVARVSDSPSKKLVRLHDFLTSVENPEYIHRAMSQKGVSITLGHAPQLGDWSAARPLDEKFRQLPQSRSLKDAGFDFSETYADKDEAMITYDVHPSDVDGTAVMGIRKRAAADIQSSDGSVYQIIKRSSYWIDKDGLDLRSQRGVKRAMARTGMDDVARNELGRSIIAPYIANRDLRRDAPRVLPVSSTYFVLNRFEE